MTNIDIMCKIFESPWSEIKLILYGVLAARQVLAHKNKKITPENIAKILNINSLQAIEKAIEILDEMGGAPWTPVHQAIEDSFLAKKGAVIYNYSIERQAIHNIVNTIEGIGELEVVAQTLIETFYKAKQEDKFYKDFPFLPSSLTRGQIINNLLAKADKPKARVFV